MNAADNDLFQEFLALFGDNLWGQALAVVVAGAVLAKIVDLVVVFLLAHWARRTRSNLDDQILEILHRPLFITVFLFGLWLAVEILQVHSTLETYLERTLLTAIVFIWVLFSIQVSHLFLTRLGRYEGKVSVVQPRTLPLFENTAKLLIICGAIYAVFLVWDVNIAALLGTLGVAGIAVGFAAKDSIANLISGILILADAPYKLGDFVVLDSGERGQVTHIGLRSTRILTRDDKEITVPNALIGNDRIVNESGGRWEKHRIRVKVGVAYGSDIDRVREVLLAVASEQPEILASPEPRVRFRRFGESSLEFELLGWIPRPVLRGRVLDALNSGVYKSFAAAGIQIPFPQLDVHFTGKPSTSTGA